MRCSRCQFDTPMTQMRFIEAGMVPGTSIKRHHGVCHTCLKQVPIDQTSKNPREDEYDAPF